MNIRKYILLASITALLLTSCNNKLNILAPYKDTTVVYGLLDQNDSVHYIRVNKAYEGEGNAYTMAQVYDSINYPYGTISVTLLDYNTNGVLVNTITLDSTTTIPLSAGIFSYPHQILYQTKAVLNAADNYQLLVHNEKTGNTVTGSTNLLSDLVITNPAYFAGNGNLTMSFISDAPTVLAWNSTVNGRLYQMTIRFFYYQINTTAHDSTLQSVDWVFPPLTAPSLTGGYQLEYNYTAQLFYQFLKSELTVSSDINRRAWSFDVILTTGSDDLNTYIQLSQPALGINQDIPTFTDLKNGIGIFTARHTQTFPKGVSQALSDSLEIDPITQPLNFVH